MGIIFLLDTLKLVLEFIFFSIFKILAQINPFHTTSKGSTDGFKAGQAILPKSSS